MYKFYNDNIVLLLNHLIIFLFTVGGNDVIEVGHPAAPPEIERREGYPVLRSGAIGSGKPIIQDDALRLDFRWVPFYIKLIH